MGPRVSTAPKTRASHWLALVALMVTTITGALSATAAVASPPPTLDAGFVTDDAGALSANELEAANTRLQELSEKSDADLFVVFVDAFTDPRMRPVGPTPQPTATALAPTSTCSPSP